MRKGKRNSPGQRRSVHLSVVAALASYSCSGVACYDVEAREAVDRLGAVEGVATRNVVTPRIDMHLPEMEKVADLGLRALPWLRKGINERRDWRQWLFLRATQRICREEVEAQCRTVLQQRSPDPGAGWIALLELQESDDLWHEKMRFLRRETRGTGAFAPSVAKRMYAELAVKGLVAVETVPRGEPDWWSVDTEVEELEAVVDAAEWSLPALEQAVRDHRDTAQWLALQACGRIDATTFRRLCRHVLDQTDSDNRAAWTAVLALPGHREEKLRFLRRAVRSLDPVEAKKAREMIGRLRMRPP